MSPAVQGVYSVFEIIVKKQGYRVVVHFQCLLGTE